MERGPTKTDFSMHDFLGYVGLYEYCPNLSATLEEGKIQLASALDNHYLI